MDLHPLPTKTTYYARMSSRKEFAPGWPHDESMARIEFLARPRLRRLEKRQQKLKQRNFNREKDVRTQTHTERHTHMKGKGMKCVEPNPFMNRAKAEHGRPSPSSSPSAVAVITAIASRLHAAIVAAARHAADDDDALSKWLIRFTSPWSVTCLLVSRLAHRASELHVWVSFVAVSQVGNVESTRERSLSQRLSHLPPEQQQRLHYKLNVFQFESRRTWAWLGMRSGFNRIDKN